MTHRRRLHEGWRSYAMSSARLAIKLYKWPCRYMSHQYAKPGRRPTSTRFQISLSLSRWEISVAERLFARLLLGLFAEQRYHSLSFYEARARDHARMKPITFFAWKRASCFDSQMSFTISNEIGVYRHQLHT